MSEPLFRTPDERDLTDLGLSPWKPAPAPHRCEGGWLGEDEAGHPIPCLTCKPHLRKTPAGWRVSRRTPHTCHTPTEGHP